MESGKMSDISTSYTYEKSFPKEDECEKEKKGDENQDEL